MKLKLLLQGTQESKAALLLIGRKFQWFVEEISQPPYSLNRSLIQSKALTPFNPMGLEEVRKLQKKV